MTKNENLQALLKIRLRFREIILDLKLKTSISYEIFRSGFLRCYHKNVEIAMFSVSSPKLVSYKTLPSYLELSFSLLAEIRSHDDSVDEKQK